MPVIVFLRFYAQTGYAAAGRFAKSGWLDDNISSLSSGGSTQAGGTVDMVAPGELSFASCTASLALYSDCASFTGAPSAVEEEESGGASRSAPTVAGAAAPVIQAYRKAHGDATPSRRRPGHPGGRDAAAIAEPADDAALHVHDRMILTSSDT